jgi:hypothetical protein
MERLRTVQMLEASLFVKLRHSVNLVNELTLVESMTRTHLCSTLTCTSTDHQTFSSAISGGITGTFYITELVEENVWSDL